MVFALSCNTSIDSIIADCKDPLACNYNINAIDNRDICIYADDVLCESCSGDNDGTGFIIINDDDNDGVCNIDEFNGCLDILACNYNSNVEQDDGSCIYPETLCEFCSGENDGTGYIINNDIDNDQICDDVDNCRYTTSNDDICNHNVELPYQEQNIIMMEHLDQSFDLCYGSNINNSIKLGDFFGKIIHFNLSASW